MKTGSLWEVIYESLRLIEGGDYKSELPDAEVREILSSDYVVYRDEEMPPVLLKVISQFGGHGLKLKGDFKKYHKDYPWLKESFNDVEIGDNCVTVSKVDELRPATPLEVHKNKRMTGHDKEAV
ncbi:hypothetical protein F937_01774 [Acinetobacter calcoaceticus ANC 3680]|uniref:hypothetical protein n=1 Tax=Acinetobacter calcoaceticus TaxID=471 RepID=UPI0002CE4C65|nr:hypothetical protein [Acinetobacter calcoaceticus]ENV92380.1 hypothetical protein F937_01774 [Acinetobacter calcoaceticus ANC 3680]